MKTEVVLNLKEEPSLPVEAENIVPENFKGKSIEEIYSIPLLLGNREMKIKDFFKAAITSTANEGAGAASFVKLHLKGDLSRFKNLGHGMAEGEMEIAGSVGFHAGSIMRGGTLMVEGDAGDWLGAHMIGGRISVSGSAGSYIGSGYLGEKEGMTGGTILIKGNAGRAVGARMKGGLIAVGGDCEELLGYGILIVSIIAAGKAGIRAGANMKKGTIILLEAAELSPLFYYNCTYEPTFWRLFYKDLKSRGLSIPKYCESAAFKRYRGDANEGGDGEVLVCQTA